MDHPALTAIGGDGRLSRTLEPRHVTMIALGGIIGAGLFVGSSAAIAAAGPAIVMSYIIAGLMVLAENRDAPAWLVQVNSRRVPTRSVWLGSAAGFAGVAAAILSPSGVFAFLVNASGALILFVYMAIACAQRRLRNTREPVLRQPVDAWGGRDGLLGDAPPAAGWVDITRAFAARPLMLYKYACGRSDSCNMRRGKPQQ